jgi:hypothetical protein
MRKLSRDEHLVPTSISAIPEVCSGNLTKYFMDNAYNKFANPTTFANPRTFAKQVPQNCLELNLNAHMRKASIEK